MKKRTRCPDCNRILKPGTPHTTQYCAYLRATSRGSKMGNVRVDVAGRSFDSRLEAETFQLLTLLEKAGEIEIIQQQHTVKLLPGVNYRADFLIFDRKIGERVWIEAKGFETEVWKLKRAVWAAGFGPGRLRVFRRKSRGDIVQTEEIIPKPLAQDAPNTRGNA